MSSSSNHTRHSSDDTRPANSGSNSTGSASRLNHGRPHACEPTDWSSKRLSWVDEEEEALVRNPSVQWRMELHHQGRTERISDFNNEFPATKSPPTLQERLQYTRDLVSAADRIKGELSTEITVLEEILLPDHELRQSSTNDMDDEGDSLARDTDVRIQRLENILHAQTEL
jgi:hypothetical protein